MKLSWSWGAFLATHGWLRSRGLSGLSWLYFFVSTPGLLAVWFTRETTADACLRALDPGPDAIVMVPRIEGLKMTEWTCRSDDLPDICLPASCRKAR